MRIAILDFTAQPSPLMDDLPRVAEQIEEWLAPVLPEAQFITHDIAHGAPMPAADAFDGLILSGSEYGVYDATAWMEPLRGLLVETKAAGKPIYGICFGHQIMADTFGGKAEKVESGFTVGARRFDHDGASVDAHFWHQDQVTAIPPDATVTSHAGHCPVSALDYDFPAKSVQFHPEYREPHLRELFRRGRDIFIKGEHADSAVASFDGANVAVDLGAADTAAFFRMHIQASGQM